MVMDRLISQKQVMILILLQQSQITQILEGWYSEPVIVPSNDWVGFLADEFGCFQAESIKNGDFKAIYLPCESG